VPPVEMISMDIAARSASEIGNPVLSVTLIRAL